MKQHRWNGAQTNYNPDLKFEKVRAGFNGSCSQLDVLKIILGAVITLYLISILVKGLTNF